MGKGADPNCGTKTEAPKTVRRGQRREDRERFSGFRTPEEMVSFARVALERTGAKTGDFLVLDLPGAGKEAEEARTAFVAAAYEMGVDLHVFDDESTLSNEELSHRSYLLQLAGKGAGSHMSMGSLGARDVVYEAHQDAENVDKALERQLIIDAANQALLDGKANKTLRYSWTMWPTPEWASRVYPGIPPAEAQARLADCLARATFADDPEGLEEHLLDLKWQADSLNQFDVDQVEIINPPDQEGEFKDHPLNRGTHLVLGMAAEQKFATCDTENIEGEKMALNNPSNEVFGTPSVNSVSGHMTTTRPAQLLDPGTGELVVVEGVYMEFEDGIMTCCEALNPEQQEVVERIFSDERMSNFISEVGLVSADTALSSETHRGKPVNFYQIVCDENAGIHVGFGAGHVAHTGGTPKSHGGDAPEALGTQPGQPHLDLVIGGPQTEVRVRNKSGQERKAIEDGRWKETRRGKDSGKAKSNPVPKDSDTAKSSSVSPDNKTSGNSKDSGSKDTPRKRMSEEARIEQIKKAYSENPDASNVELASVLGVTTARISSLRKKAGLPQGKRGRPKGSRNKSASPGKRMSEEARIEQIKKAYSENPDASNVELASVLGVTTARISSLRKKAGLPQGKRGRRKKDSKE